MKVLEILDFVNLTSIFLIFMRVLGFFMVVPMFGRKSVPFVSKIGLSLFLTIILYNIMGNFNYVGTFNMYQYFYTVFKEIILGIILGFISFIVFGAIYIAGQLIDMQMGFGIVNVIDPVNSIQVPITSNFYNIFMMVVLFSFKGHYLLIQALFDSYEYIPLGGANFHELLIDDIIRILGNIFVIGFKIAAPVTATVLVADIALGVLSKAIPQFNVFIVGMPLKIALSITIILLSAPILIEVLITLLSDVNKEMLIFIRKVGEGP